MRLEVFAGKNPPPNLRKRVRAFRIGRIVRAATPYGVFVELDSLTRSTSKNHRAQPAVPKRQGLYPSFGRLLVPEGQIIGILRLGLRDGRIRFRVREECVRKSKGGSRGNYRFQKVTSFHRSSPIDASRNLSFAPYDSESRDLFLFHRWP